MRNPDKLGVPGIKPTPYDLGVNPSLGAVRLHRIDEVDSNVELILEEERKRLSAVGMSLDDERAKSLKERLTNLFDEHNTLHDKEESLGDQLMKLEELILKYDNMPLHTVSKEGLEVRLADLNTKYQRVLEWLISSNVDLTEYGLEESQDDFDSHLTRP